MPSAFRPVVSAIAATFALGLPVSPQTPHSVIQSKVKITTGLGGLSAVLENGGDFGWSITTIGDLDGNGVVDLAVGAAETSANTGVGGSVWILFMKNNGTVESSQQISSQIGGFTETLQDGDHFGYSVTWLGDLGPSAQRTLAVGSPFHSSSVFLLFLNTTGTVSSHLEIQTPGTDFGTAVAWLGDLGPGAPTPRALAVGAMSDTDPIFQTGSTGTVRILFLNDDGTIHTENKIGSLTNPMPTQIPGGSQFGSGLAWLGDLGSTAPTSRALAVGAYQDDGGGLAGSQRGAVWILFLDADGDVDQATRITEGEGGFTGQLDDVDWFGFKLSAQDLDGDGINDLIAGALGDDDGADPGEDRLGAAWFLYLNSDGTVKCHHKISDTRGGFGATTPPGGFGNLDQFGSSSTSLGDLDGNGVVDVVISAKGDGLTNQAGAIHVLFLKSAFEDFCDGHPGTGGVIPQIDGYGCSIPGGVTDLVISGGGGNLAGVFATDNPSNKLPCPGFPVLGGNLVILPLISLGVPLAGGTAKLPLTIPPTTTVGAKIYWQVLILDAGASNGVSFTPGLEMTILEN